MELLLQRLETDGERLTTSALFVGKTLYGFVPEDPPREVKIKKITRIPAGRYRLELKDSPTFSQKYGHPMIYLVNVQKPDGSFRFDGVMFHPLNRPDQTDGCLGVNAQILVNPDGDNLFYLSGQAYGHLYKEVGTFLANGGEAWLTVRDEEYLWREFNPSPVPVSVA